MKNLYRLNSLFYKFAVETPSWIPPNIKSYMENIDKIEKDPRLKDFREKIDKNIIEDVQQDEFLKNLREFGTLTLQKIIISIKKALYYILDEPISKSFYEFLKLYIDKFQKLETKIFKFNNSLNKENLNLNKILIDKNTFKVTKYYNLLKKEVENTFIDFYKNLSSMEYTEELKTKVDDEKRDQFMVHVFGNMEKVNKLLNFDDIPNKKDWDNRLKNKDYYVVFSTDYKDILGMSSRSDWTSCQDMRPEKPGKESNFYMKTIGSAFEPSVGIIYLTDGSDTKYGEKMIMRSMVWIVINNETREEVLSIQRIYPNDSKIISDLFKEELKKHTGFDVIDIFQDKLNEDNYKTYFSGKYLMPYDDIGITKTQIIDENFENFSREFSILFKTYLRSHFRKNAIIDIQNITLNKLLNNISLEEYTKFSKDPNPTEDNKFLTLLSIITKDLIVNFCNNFIEQIIKDIDRQPIMFSDYLVKLYQIYINNHRTVNKNMFHYMKNYIKDNKNKILSFLINYQNTFKGTLYDKYTPVSNFIIEDDKIIPKTINETIIDYL